MIFSQQPPSKHWAALKYRGEKFAEVWFKPEGEPFGVTFRIPQKSFQIPGMAEQLTLANLLTAVAIDPEEVDSWRHGDGTHSCLSASDPESTRPLPPPPQHLPELDIHVRLKQPQAVPPSPPVLRGRGAGGEGEEHRDPTPPPITRESGERSEPEIPLIKSQDLEARWKAILALEATMDTLRISMESLLAQMEASFKKTLTTEEKLYAPRADVAQWNKAKSRVHVALPKVKEFIHRATWAIAAPERKRLDEIYKDHIQPHIPFPQMDQVLKQLEDLQKDRQVLSAHGQTVYQEARTISADVQGTLRTLQNNAAANAHKKKGGSGSGGKFLKDVRRMTGN